MLGLHIPLFPSSEVAGDALELAILEHRPIDDMMYIALARRSDCEFITADQKLVRAIQGRYSCVRWIGGL